MPSLAQEAVRLNPRVATATDFKKFLFIVLEKNNLEKKNSVAQSAAEIIWHFCLVNWPTKILTSAKNTSQKTKNYAQKTVYRRYKI